jgi:hypothetical protein
MTEHVALYNPTLPGANDGFGAGRDRLHHEYMEKSRWKSRLKLSAAGVYWDC